MKQESTHPAADFSVRSELGRRDFLRYSLGSLVMVSTGSLVAGCGGTNAPIAGYAIAPDVVTTLQNMLVLGPKPTEAVHLYQVSMFQQYGYGNWTLGAPLAAEKRTDLMPAGYAIPDAGQKVKLLTFFTISDIHITDKEAPNQLLLLQEMTDQIQIVLGLRLG